MQKKLLRVIIPLLIMLFVALTQNTSSEPKQSVLSTTPTPLPIVTQATASATVVKVVDGDTLHVQRGEEKETIRLIGVDTPELHDPRKPVECFAKEAKAYLESLVLGKKVTLEADSSQSNRDIYGRLLRYVKVKGILVNQQIVAEGYGYEYTYDLPYRYQKDFQQAEITAKEQQKGLWNPTTCPDKK